MPSQKKRKIKIVTIHDSFFKLVKDTEPELLQIRKEMQRRPCLVLLKIKYKGKNYTFALPMRSNISKLTPNRKSTKAFPIDPKYLISYKMDGDFFGEYILAYIEKNIDTIVKEFKNYLLDYEKGQYYKYHVDIDHLILMQNL